jgi:hypothetical protein
MRCSTRSAVSFAATSSGEGSYTFAVITRLVRSCALGRVIQYAAAAVVYIRRLGVLDHPVEPGDDSGVWG